MHLNLLPGATLGTLSTCWDVLIKNLFVKMFSLLLLFCSSSACKEIFLEKDITQREAFPIICFVKNFTFSRSQHLWLSQRTGEKCSTYSRKSFNTNNNKMLDTLKRDCVCRPPKSSFAISQNWLFITRHWERYSAFIQFNLASRLEPCAICYNSPNKTQLAWIFPDSWCSLVSNWNALVNIKCFN